MTVDQRTFYEKLRADTRRMFGFADEDTLTPEQSMRIDLAVVLRSEIDSIQGAQIAGRSIDVGRLSDAIKLLRQLMPQEQEQSDLKPDFAGAFDKLSAMMSMQHEKMKQGLARWPDKARADLEEQIKQAIAANPDITPTAYPGGPPLAELLLHPALRSSPTALLRDTWPPSHATSETISAVPETPLATQSPQPPLPPPSSAPPSHYLRRDDGVIQIGRGYDRWSNRG